MYKNIKSCVFANGQISSSFPCETGVRQGENLSPVLFSIFLNDLELHLRTNGSTGISLSSDFNETIWLNILIMLYADDTVLLSDSALGLQNTLNNFQEYCHQWHLKDNLEKTKVVIFGAKKTDKFKFVYQNNELEITENYKYLGLIFSNNGSFLKARQHLAAQARKAMHYLLVKSRKLDLPIDLQLKLFDHTVAPVLLYGSETWGYENHDILEKVHIDFMRKITKAKSSTPHYMLYGELGRYPLS